MKILTKPTKLQQKIAKHQIESDIEPEPTLTDEEEVKLFERDQN